MSNFIKLSEDAVILENATVAVVKTREEVATKTGIEQHVHVWIYLEKSQVPIVITTKNEEEAEQVMKKALGE
jgi:hypothetical protein